MSKYSGWVDVEGKAKANGVTHGAFVARIRSGYTPEEAANSREELNEIRIMKNINSMVGHKTAMSRIEALEEIDKIQFSKCESCAEKKRLVNKTSQLTKICVNDCPVGKEIQALSKFLTVGPRKSAIGSWNTD